MDPLNPFGNPYYNPNMPGSMPDYGYMPGWIVGNPMPTVPAANVPGLPGGLGGLAGMAMPSLMTMLAQGNNQLAGSSIFSGGSTHNPYRFMQANARRAEYQAAMAMAATSDSDAIRNMSAGLMRSLGLEPSPQYQDAMQSMMGSWGGTIAAFNPRLLESFGGRSMASMGQAMIAGQTLVDPMSGLMGYSGDTAGSLSRELSASMSSDPLAFRGIMMSRSMEGLAAASLRGGGVGSIRGRLGEAAINRLAQGGSLTASDLQRSGMTGEEMSMLESAMSRQGGQAGVSSGLRDIDIRRSSEWMKENTELVRSLEDVFGADGSMPQLQEALNKLTQHNESRMSKHEQGRVAREFRTLTEMTHFSMDTMTQMLGVAGAEIREQGGPLRAVQDVGQETLLRQYAYRQFGLGEMYNLEELAMSDVKRGAQAASSNAANQIGFIARLQKRGLLAPGSESEARLQAAMAGETEFNTGGGSQSIYTRDTSSLLEQLSRETGISVSDLSTLYHQSDENLKSAADANTLASTIGLQYTMHARPQMVQAMMNTLQANDRNMSAREATAEAEAFVSDMESMSVEQRNDRGAATAVLAERIASRNAGMTNAQAMAQAEIRWGIFESQGGGRKLMDTHFANAEARQMAVARMQTQVALEEATSGLTSRSGTENIANYLQRVGTGEADGSLSGFLGAWMGNVDVDQLKQAMGDTAYGEFEKQINDLMTTTAGGIDPTTGTLKKETVAQIELAMKELSKMTGGASELLDESVAIQNVLGLSGEKDISKLLRDSSAGKTLSEAQRNTISTQLGSAVSDLLKRPDRGGKQLTSMAERMGISVEDLVAGSFDGFSGLSDEQLHSAAQAVVQAGHGLGAMGEIESAAGEALADAAEGKGGKSDPQKVIVESWPEDGMVVTGTLEIDGEKFPMKGKMHTPKQGAQ